MNRYYDAKLGMYKYVHDFLVENAATVAAAHVPMIITYKTTLVNKIDAILSTSEETTRSSIGITVTKAQAARNAIRQAATLAGWIYSYANDNNKTALKVEMSKISFAYLKAKKDEAVIDDLYLILYSGQKNSVPIPPATTNPLVPYGLRANVGDVGEENYEPGTLALLEEAISLYADLTTAPRKAISTRKTYNKALESLYKDTDTLLIKLDKVVEGLKLTFSAFYNGYKNARILVGPMTLHTRIAGTVTDAITGVPLSGVKATALASSVPADVLTATTDEQGQYDLHTPQFRLTYLLKFSRTGYNELQQSGIVVRKGKTTTINVSMEPVL